MNGPDSSSSAIATCVLTRTISGCQPGPDRVQAAQPGKQLGVLHARNGARQGTGPCGGACSPNPASRVSGARRSASSAVLRARPPRRSSMRWSRTKTEASAKPRRASSKVATQAALRISRVGIGGSRGGEIQQNSRWAAGARNRPEQTGAPG